MRRYTIRAAVLLPLLIASCGGRVEPAFDRIQENGGSGGDSLGGAGGAQPGAGGSHAGSGGSLPGSGGALPEAGPDVVPPEAGPDAPLDVVVTCPEDGTCSGHGTCDTSTGTCQCVSGFDGATCAQCIAGYSGYPDCHVPLPCPSGCSGFGTCDDKTGTCSCDDTHAGPGCDECAEGYVGYPACAPAKPCPNDCSDHGTCDGFTGACQCSLGYTGEACNACTTATFAFNKASALSVKEPVNLALGDIDGDGLLDLAVSNWSQPTVTTFRGLGTGFFEAKSELIAHGYPSEVSLVDLDADGWLDLVVLADGQIDGVGPFCVFHNYGAGAFGPKQLLEMPHDAASFDTGDVNSDGKPDLVVSTFEPQLMSVLQGDGTGGFVPIVPVPIGPQPWTVAAGDLDGDGVDDIVVPAGFAVGVLFSKAGFPAPMVTLPLSHWGFGVAIADLNGDGLRDIAATVQAGKLSYMLNQGGGSFAPALMHDTVNGALYLATGDLNLDGLADLVLPGIWDGGTAVILSTGTGLVNHSVLAPGSQPHDVAIGDVNQDGRPDLVVGNSNVDEVVVYLNECVP